MLPVLAMALLLMRTPPAAATAPVHVDGDTPWAILSADPHTGDLGSAFHTYM